MTTSFFKKRFTLRQPDGTELSVLGTGNQAAARFETLDGHTVVRDPATGFYELAVLDRDADELRPIGVAPGDVAPETLKLAVGAKPSPARRKREVQESRLPPGGSRWEQRLAARRAPAAPGVALAPPSRKTVGDYRGLVLLIEFPDVPATITQQEVEAYCNQPGYTGFGNNGSVYDYFREVSGERLCYTNIVAPYYRAKRSRAYYTNERVAQPQRARELVREALRFHKENGLDFTQLTLDGARCAYAVNVFYAGPVMNNWAMGLWPHSYHLGTPFPLGADAFAHDYQITSMGSELSLGTFCHENGHMICDFPDLYDYGYESRGIGDYCLMCSGGSDEKNPAHVSAYLKYRAGWGTARPLTPGRYEAAAGANDFYLHARTAKEYLIIENRRRSGRDAALPAEGLAVWHVDETASNNEQSTPEMHYECSLIQADGFRELERGVNSGNVDDLFGSPRAAEFANSKWWDGTPTELKLADITAPGPVIAFVVG